MPKCEYNKVEIALRHGCSPVNLLHIFRTTFTINTSEGMLLFFSWIVSSISSFIITDTTDWICFILALVSLSLTEKKGEIFNWTSHFLKSPSNINPFLPYTNLHYPIISDLWPLYLPAKCQGPPNIVKSADKNNCHWWRYT